MTDKPPVCLSCDGTKFEEKPLEFSVELDEMYVNVKTDAWECQECRTLIMTTGQMGTMRHLLDLTGSKKS